MMTMKALHHLTYGSPDVLHYTDVERPTIGSDEVLVGVHASSVNPADLFLVTGTPMLVRLSSGLRRPKHPIPGRDVAGRVEAVGADVTTLQPGDRVFGESERGGGYAEHVALPADGVATFSEKLTFEQAAAAPLAGITALQGLRDAGNLEPGQKVLINGASGGVGTFAVQIAKALGAEVTGVCSTANLDLVTSIGADKTIDYTADDFTVTNERYDLILDLVGDRPLGDVRSVLDPKGTLVLAAGGSNRWIGPLARILRGVLASMVSSQRIVPLIAKQTKPDLEALRDLLESGEVTPVIDRCFPLNDAATALHQQGVGHAKGKTIIKVTSAS